MRPLFHPKLVNEPFGDPGLFVDFLFEKRALLFDLGEIHHLPPRKLLRVSHVFVSHTHMDHFIGFDTLLRICLGREKKVFLYGPPNFLEQVEHKLASYTWNLVENYATDFTLVVTEVNPDCHARSAEFHCQSAFRREKEKTWRLTDNVLLDETMFCVRYAMLDHKIPSMAFALEEKSHVNIWKNRLMALALPIGPWLKELKRAVLSGEPDDTLIRAWWVEEGERQEKVFQLGKLKEQVVRIVPGQKLAYVTDVVYHAENASRIAALASGAYVLFIESTFLQQDVQRAAEKYHLTAWQAGIIARQAGVATVIPFHFSPIYSGNEALLRQELEKVFSLGICLPA
ncbi:ribonuclease Z [Sulfurirhabdus autotrophica]|uniref:Ribonuclease Z n=1 Tax=Sulfurirhabdus autotrophica TaxID=1706046 RepID=A0A4R3XS61_9PROT|nr:MBL fold metallo-hydrolase [Sulfurirhabdus autotrophica]TCV80107.1 ribonuclease Z [Sulfurirhabdus autotrophica]